MMPVFQKAFVHISRLLTAGTEPSEEAEPEDWLWGFGVFAVEVFLTALEEEAADADAAGCDEAESLLSEDAPNEFSFSDVTAEETGRLLFDGFTFEQPQNPATVQNANVKESIFLKCIKSLRFLYSL